MFDQIQRAVRSIYGTGKQVPLHAPVLDDLDKAAVVGAIDSGFVSSVGKEVDEFERRLEEFTGASKAVAVVNGTAALHLALLVSGVKQGDLVLTQALTFVATANAISYTGADPVFLDSDHETLGLSHEAVSRFLVAHASMRDGQAVHKSSGRVIRACVPMHVFGHPVKMTPLLEVCKHWGIAVVEDAAEALGSFEAGKHAGTLAPVGVLSFNGNKIITTGGGGALLFQDPALAAKAKHLSTTAKRPHPWLFEHDEIGFNYRMPNLNAALGCSQLSKLQKFIDRKRQIAETYRSLLSANVTTKFIVEREGTKANYWLNALLLSSRAERDQLLESLNSVGIGCRPAWQLLSDLSMFKHCLADDLRVAKDLQERLLNLPSGVI